MSAEEMTTKLPSILYITALVILALGGCVSCFVGVLICRFYARKKRKTTLDETNDNAGTFEFDDQLTNAETAMKLLTNNGLLSESYYTLCDCLEVVQDLGQLDDVHGRKTDKFLQSCLTRWLDNSKTYRDLIRVIKNADEHHLANAILERSRTFTVLKQQVSNIFKSLSLSSVLFHVLKLEEIVDLKVVSEDNKEHWLLSQLINAIIYLNCDTIYKFAEALEMCGHRQIALTILKEGGLNLQPVSNGSNDMSQHFENLIADVVRIMSRNDSCNIKMLKDCIMCDPNSTLKLKMRGCPNDTMFWELIKENCSSINVEPLERIVSMLNVKQAINCIREYKNQLEEFCRTKLILDCIHRPFYPSSFLRCQTIRLLVKRSMQKDTSLHDINVLLATAFKNESKSIKIVKISLKRYSFTLTCSFPVTMTNQLLANAFRNLPVLTNVLRLTIGHCSVYDHEARKDNKMHMASVYECTGALDQVTVALRVQIIDKNEELGYMNQHLQILEDESKGEGTSEILSLSQAYKELKMVKEEKDEENEATIQELQNRIQSLESDTVKKLKRMESFSIHRDETNTIISRIKDKNEEMSKYIGCEQSLDIYKLKTNSTQIHDTIYKYTFGIPSKDMKPTKVLLLVGETGAGKSTLINGIVNYVLGVKFEDDFRFKLIYDETTKSQSLSQTDDITVYTFYWQEGFQVPYNLTIIDTPGFGDTRGIERDKKIPQQLMCLLSVEGNEGIDRIHGIGFVSQSSFSYRFMPTRLYRINSILGLFGKDVKKHNFFVILTHYDNSYPEAWESLKEAKVPLTKNFFVNNGGLYYNPDDPITKPLWDKSNNGYQELLHTLEDVTPVSLDMTSEVLNKKKQLHVTLSEIHKLVKEGLAKKDELQQHKETLRQKEADIEANEKFENEDRITKKRKVDLTNGESAANCITCEMTCQYPCKIADDEMYECAAMDIGGEDGAKCEICPDRCSWRDHQNQLYRFEDYEEVEVKRCEDKFQRYNQAITEKSHVEQIISKLQDEEMAELTKEVHKDIDQVNQYLTHLNDIALKPNTKEKFDNFDILIDEERKQKAEGYQERIDKYIQIKEEAQILADISATDIDNRKHWWQFWL